MKWTDKGIVLAITPFSEDQARLSILTRSNGRQTGLFRQSKRQSVLHIGDHVSATWNARLSEHLGRFQIERVDSPAPRMFGDSWRLWLLQNTCGLMINLPERHPYSMIFDNVHMFIQTLTTSPDYAAFVDMTLLEKLILAELGFGIDLSECCVTQSKDNLKFISPKTGRAVSKSAASPYVDKLFPLPMCWLNAGELGSRELILNEFQSAGINPILNEIWSDISNAFLVTHHFWQKWLFDDTHTFPAVRVSIARYCEKKWKIV